MASTTFIDGQSVIYASWLNDVNTAVYTGVFPNGSISLTNLNVSGTVTGAGFTTVVNSTLLAPGAIGSATPNTGAFTTLSANSATLTGALNANSAVLTTALPISSGGTGLYAVGTSGYVLASNGSALTYKKLGLGMTGETWATLSRAFNTTYTNNNTYPIMVLFGWATPSSNGSIFVIVNGLQILAQGDTSNSYSLSFIVPPGQTYQINASGSATLSSWSELF